MPPFAPSRLQDHRRIRQLDPRNQQDSTPWEAKDVEDQNQWRQQTWDSIFTLVMPVVFPLTCTNLSSLCPGNLLTWFKLNFCGLTIACMQLPIAPWNHSSFLESNPSYSKPVRMCLGCSWWLIVGNFTWPTSSPSHVKLCGTGCLRPPTSFASHYISSFAEVVWLFYHHHPPKKISEVAHVDYDESFNTARRGRVNVISKKCHSQSKAWNTKVPGRKVSIRNTKFASAGCWPTRKK